MPTSYDNMPKSVEEPAPTIQATRRHHYIVNPSHGGHSTSTEAPCPVIVARQDKAPLYLVQVENGQVSIAVFDGDSEICIRIKQFMAIYGLVDIKMRMLRVNELLLIQGFPVGYKLEGNQSDQKKFIGNSVVPHVVKAWTEALATKLITNLKEKRA
jgi:DNA (cytosine-5)-methyltransferase 1